MSITELLYFMIFTVLRSFLVGSFACLFILDAFPFLSFPSILLLFFFLPSGPSGCLYFLNLLYDMYCGR